jgi:hypothetical protein
LKKDEERLEKEEGRGNQWAVHVRKRGKKEEGRWNQWAVHRRKRAVVQLSLF